MSFGASGFEESPTMNPKYANKYQFKVLALVSAAVVALGLVLYLLDPAIYQDILGFMHPLVALQFVILAYFLFFLYLLGNTSLVIYRKKSWKVYLGVFGIALFFGVLVIAADLWWVNYPLDINIPVPESLLYYPVMGYMAEAVFHLLPLIFFFFLLKSVTRLPMYTILMISLVLAAIAEPVFQIVVGDYDANTRIFTGIHVFLFSIAQLWVFRYYDWVTMYLLRLFYYGIWHIAWGAMRMEVLFG